MEFISNEAVEDGLLVSSDNKEGKIADELEDFIGNDPQPHEDVSFYRQLDPTNLDDYSKFHGQTRNPIKVIYEDDTPFYGHEDQNLNTPEDRESVSFDKFVRVLKNLSKNLKRP